MYVCMYVCVCQYVCWSRSCALQKRLNRSRCRLKATLGGNRLLDVGRDPNGKGQVWELHRSASLDNTVINPENSRSCNAVCGRVGQMQVNTAFDVVVKA